MLKLIAVLGAAIMLGLSAGGATAKSRPFKATDYPIEVRKTLSLGPVTCREVEGATLYIIASASIIPPGNRGAPPFAQ